MTAARTMVTHPLRRLLDTRERIVAGLMSGTSLDGIDAVVARLAGSGPGMTMEVLGAAHHGFDSDLLALLRANVEDTTSSAKALAQLGIVLAHRYADVITDACEAAGLSVSNLDLVGVHGQTVQHVPQAEHIAGQDGVRATLQIGSGPTLATLLGVPVVHDFRAADLALGGEGAPLVPYLDLVRFAHPTEARLLLNLGGIANMTVLPPGATADTLAAFDSGPANILIDALAQRFYGTPCDLNGQHAAAGAVNGALLDRLLGDAYFAQPPPKSTGREHFGAAFLDWHFLSTALRPDDLLATATALTARTVHEAYERFVAPAQPVDVVIAAGGGVRNPTLMQQLRDAFDPIPIHTTADYGVEPDLKEALCFAVLAHEYVNGTPTSLPRVTGADRPALLGSLALA
ncbi:MAG: anhydro-N-acetylmuramic acid kinase [Bacteroidota bacterium]